PGGPGPAPLAPGRATRGPGAGPAGRDGEAPAARELRPHRPRAIPRLARPPGPRNPAGRLPRPLMPGPADPGRTVHAGHPAHLRPRARGAHRAPRPRGGAGLRLPRDLGRLWRRPSSWRLPRLCRQGPRRRPPPLPAALTANPSSFTPRPAPIIPTDPLNRPD